MNLETPAACRAVGASIYEPFAGFDAKTMAPAAFRIEAWNKMCNPLAGISISPGTLRMCNRLADIIPPGTLRMCNRLANFITPEMAAALSAQMEQRTKVEKLMASIVPLPPRR